MADVYLNGSFERYFYSDELKEELKQMGCISMKDVLRIPYIKLITNTCILRNWDVYSDTMCMLANKTLKEK